MAFSTSSSLALKGSPAGFRVFICTPQGILVQSSISHNCSVRPLIRKTASDFVARVVDGRGLVRLEAGAGSLAGFELAVEDEGGIGEFFRREAEGALKKISAGLRPVRAMRPMPFWR